MVRSDSFVHVQDLFWDRNQIRIAWDDGHTSTYQAAWLRDNCPEDRDPNNGQRLVDIADLPPNPTIGTVAHDNSGAFLDLSWQDESKRSRFDLHWLRDHCYCEEHLRTSCRRVRTWSRERAGELAWMNYAEVFASDEARFKWLSSVANDGIAFLRNVPVEEGTVVDVAKLAGYIYETNYGKVFDVRSVPRPNNLAYTDIALGLHTDNPYRNPVPGYQLLHCLRASKEGGISQFVDGFAIAESLASENPQAFAVLTQTPIRFSFRDAHAELTAMRPIVHVDQGGQPNAIHYNNRSIAPLRLSPREVSAFYDAYRAFAQILRDPKFEFRVKLRAGDLVLFDNWRILHGRTRFNAHESGRHLQGCYLNRDGPLSNLAVLQRRFGFPGFSPSGL